jgi:hypothetical protein
MIQLLSLLASSGAVASAGAMATLDYSQVTRRAQRIGTQSITYIHGGREAPTSVLERAVLLDDALGGQVRADTNTEAAFALVINAQSRPAVPNRTVRGALPFGL